jgi:hypothetical protein
MEIVFGVCAAIGVTILVIQLILALTGLGGHGFDADAPHDFGGDLAGDAAGFHGDAVGHGDMHGDAHGDSHDAGQQVHHGSTWLFGVISFRTVVAALAFFGLGGLAAQAAEASLPMTLLVATAAGAAAMYGVYGLMRAMYSLKAEGTARIQRAIGQTGSVYLTVPAEGAGLGKVQVNLQNRTMEYLAHTSGPELVTGTKVVVVAVLASDTVEVRAIEAA